MKWTTFNLRISNAHVVHGRRPILIDSGPPGSFRSLQAKLEASGLDAKNLGALVLTHGHADHAGNAAKLVEEGVPALLGSGDLPLATSGKNPEVRSTGLTAQLLRPLLPWSYPPFAPTKLVATSVDLSPFGLEGFMRVVGGHSPGSSIVVAGDLLVAGDLVRGGYLGGVLFSGRARIHYYSDDPESDLIMVLSLIDEHRPKWILLGHGGPLSSDSARRRIEAILKGFSK